jgi:hypothetical protein
VKCSNEHDPQVHPEVEDLENLRLGERQNHNACEFGDRNPRQNLRQNIISSTNNSYIYE